jgi:hypothetical protein
LRPSAWPDPIRRHNRVGQAHYRTAPSRSTSRNRLRWRRSAHRKRRSSLPMHRLGPAAADTIPIAAPAIPRVRSIRLQ